MFLFHIFAIIKSRISDEADLIKRITERDEKALSKLYDRYAKLLYGFIFTIVKKQAEAEDVLQELFVQIWEKASSFDTARGNVYTWLVTLARNRAIDRIRSKQYRTQGQHDADFGVELIENPDGSSPLDAVVTSERADVVRNALQTLPAEQREVIQIAYFGGYTQTEIAAQLNVPLGTIKTRMRQGMKKLQAQLMGQT